MKKVIMHGECVIRQIDKLPEGLNNVEAKNGFVVVAESEVTGNDHRVVINSGVKFFEKDGVLYMENTLPTTVGCVIKERHDDCVLEPAIWEFRAALEYDPIEAQLRQVAD